MDNDLNRILSSDRDVIPSTQFVSNVMAAVHREASVPAPLSFPWRHALPGLAISVAALAWLLVVATIQFRAGYPGTAPESIVVLSVVGIGNRVELGWVALALVASFVPTKLALARV